MNKSRILGIAALAVQILNAGAVVVGSISPEYGVYIAAAAAAVSAFTARVQGVK